MVQLILKLQDRKNIRVRFRAVEEKSRQSDKELGLINFAPE